MKRVMFALLSMALAGASFALKASAATTTTSTPFNATVLNCFNGQPVMFSGIRRETSTVTTTPSNNVDFVDHVDFSDVKGTDPSGNSYVGHQTSTDGLHISFYGALAITVPVSFGMVSKGSSPNMLVHALMHITINPGQQMTSNVDSFTTNCPP
jgi:hypothetical protein